MMLPIYVLMAVVGDKISAGNPANRTAPQTYSTHSFTYFIANRGAGFGHRFEKRIPAGTPPGCSFLEIDYNQS